MENRCLAVVPHSSKGRGVREAIHTLSLILAGVGLPKLPSEAFRLAKLDSAEAINPFLELLYQTCLLVRQLPEVGGPYVPFQGIRTYAEGQEQWARLTVMKFLFSLGYCKVELFSESTSSRQLLLAFGWLIHKCHLVVRLKDYHLYLANHPSLPVRSSLSTSLEQTIQKIREWSEEVATATSIAHKDLLCSAQRLIWLRGQFKREYSILHSSASAYQTLNHALHQNATCNDHCTLLELHLLRYPDQLDSYYKFLTDHLTALQIIDEWETQAGVFWQWMESVLDLDKTGTCEEECDGRDLESLARDVSLLERRVQLLVSQNKPLIDKLNVTVGSIMTHTPEKLVQQCYSELTWDPGWICLQGLSSVVPDPISRYSSHMMSLQSHDTPAYSTALVRKNSTQKCSDVASHTTVLQESVGKTSHATDWVRSAVRQQLTDLLCQLPPSVCTVNKTF